MGAYLTINETEKTKEAIMKTILSTLFPLSALGGVAAMADNRQSR